MSLDSWVVVKKLRTRGPETATESIPVTSTAVPLESHPAASPSPRSIVSWNLNGLSTRIKLGDFAKFGNYVAEEKFDVVCLQEVKLTAAGPAGSTKGDGRPRNRGKIRDDTKANRQEADTVNRLLSMQEPWIGYDKYWSLADWRYAGQLVLVKKELKPLRTKYNLLSDEKSAAHHEEGRVILLTFKEFKLLATYGPNHGWQESHFHRRRQWDDAVCYFLQAEAAQINDPPLIWTGDLNAAPEEMDQTHFAWFRKQLPETMRGRQADLAAYRSRVPEIHRGQPGCTEYERQQFHRYLKNGDLVDCFRQQHPDGPPRNPSKNLKENESRWDVAAPHFTWRGVPGLQTDDAGRYFGKGMRIDHFLVNTRLLKKFKVKVNIVGYGVYRTMFFGSDHSPLTCELSGVDDIAVPPSIKIRRVDEPPEPSSLSLGIEVPLEHTDTSKPP